jgi:hypothetical protein
MAAHMNEGERQDSGAAEQEELVVTVTFPVTERHIARKIRLPPLEFRRFYNIYRAINSIDLIDVKDLAIYFGLAIKQEQLTEKDALRLSAAIKVLRRDEHWETPEDPILSLTYFLLQQRDITHTQAADFASEILGRQIKVNTWKQRVRRWAQKQGLPPVGQRTRKQKKVTE